MQIGVLKKIVKEKQKMKNLLTITYVYDNLFKDCRRQ